MNPKNATQLKDRWRAVVGAGVLTKYIDMAAGGDKKSGGAGKGKEKEEEEEEEEDGEEEDEEEEDEQEEEKEAAPKRPRGRPPKTPKKARTLRGQRAAGP